MQIVVKITPHEPTELSQSSSISRTVNLLFLRTTVLTSEIISSFFDVDGRPERVSLSAEVLTYLFTYLLTYLITYLLTYLLNLLTYLLHGAESFLST